MTETKLFGQIAKVMAEVRSLPKNGHNKQNNYDYVSSDDALESIGKAMAKHGVVVIPSMTSYESATEGKMTRTRANFDMHICSDDGFTFTSQWSCEGIDYGNPDKALTKAITYATKTFLLKLFVVGAGGDDPDGESAPTETQATRTQAPNGKPPKKQPQRTIETARSAFHAAGTELFGNDWDGVRGGVVKTYSAEKSPSNVRTSSNDLTIDELDALSDSFRKSGGWWRKWLTENMAEKQAA